MGVQLGMEVSDHLLVFPEKYLEILDSYLVNGSNFEY